MTDPLSKSAFPVASGNPLTVSGVVSMTVDAAGQARAAAFNGEDKVVYTGIGTTGAVIFATPPTAGLTTTAIAALTTTQIAALTSNVVIADVTPATLTTTAIGALVAGAYYDAPIALTVTQLNTLSTSTISPLTTTQIAALTTTQIMGQVPLTIGAIAKPDMPVSTMLSVVTPSGETATVTVRAK